MYTLHLCILITHIYTTHESSGRRPMPHNIITAWSAEEYPNPMHNASACGLWKRGYVCDPNQLLTEHGMQN
jgi:hypothetical protein